MNQFKLVLFLSSLIFFSQSLVAQEKLDLSLLVRADQFKAFNLPPLSKMPNMTPACFEDNKLAVRYWEVLDEIRIAVQLFDGESFFKSQNFESGFVIGDMFLNEEGVVFAVNDRFRSLGAFLLDYNGKQTRIVNPNDYEGLRAVSRPALINKVPLFRGLHSNGLRTIYLGTEKLLAEENSNIAYIFLPTTKNNEFSVRVNYGTPGDVDVENKDELFLYKESKFHSIAKDRDLDPQSDFLSFDSSSVPDGNGGLLFIAESEKHGRSLWYFNIHQSIYELIYSSADGFGNLEYFRASIGGDKKIFFRTIKDQKRSLVAWDNGRKFVIATQGDFVNTNEGELSIIDRQSWPAFAGSICASNEGEVYVNAVLEGPQTKENKGSGVFTTK